MQKPAIPSNEPQRLSDLRALKLLDTPAEERFDRLTRLAQRLFGVPIALVSLVDSERQWFKSKQGLNASETPRDVSFCGHAILQDDVFYVPNALDDPRFADNPLVRMAPDIRFYAGAPLFTRGGYRVGTLCVIDRKPKILSPEDRRALRDLGDLVQDEFDRADIRDAVATIREEEALLRAILDGAAYSIISTNVDGTIRIFNRAAEKMLGYDADELIGKKTPAVFHDINEALARAKSLSDELGRPIAPGFEVFVAKARRDEPDEREWTYIRKDGSRLPVLLSVTALRAGQDAITGFLGIAYDISERQKIDQLKNEFVSTVSHELRTPLTSIRGSLGLIAGGAVGAMPPQAAQLIDIAHKNSERLVRLVNDILDIEKIESGKMHFDLVQQPLTPLVQHAIEATRAFAAELRVTVELADEADAAIVRVDSDRLIQVVTNLISNAAKFSPENGVVRLSIDMLGRSVRVSVADRGPGIPEEFRGRIFQKFSQADASDARQKAGSGLGLAITKSLVESMGGAVGFATSGAGTTFWFEFPAISVPLRSADAEETASRPKILVCEDDQDIAVLIRMILNYGGFDAEIAHDADQAKQMLAQSRYAAMTLDIRLPGKDGVALIRELRAERFSENLPIIVVSAAAQGGKTPLLGGVTVTDWLQKPIDHERLLSAVRRGVGDAASARPRVLHVEDDPDVRRVVEIVARDTADFDFASDLDAARRLLATVPYSLVILDLELPDGNGGELLPLITSMQPDARVMVFSANDAPREMTDYFDACLLKSAVTNDALLATIKAQTAHRTEGSGTGDERAPVAKNPLR